MRPRAAKSVEADEDSFTEEKWRGLIEQMKADDKVEDLLADIEKDFAELDEIYKDLDGL